MAGISRHFSTGGHSSKCSIANANARNLKADRVVRLNAIGFIWDVNTKRKMMKDEDIDDGVNGGSDSATIDTSDKKNITGSVEERKAKRKTKHIRSGDNANEA